MLSWITFAPLLVIPPILLAPRSRPNLIRWLAVLGTAVPLVLAFQIFMTYDRAGVGINEPESFQYVIKMPWLESFNIQYYMGIDGLSVSMLLLTALLSFLCIFASWGIEKGLKGYFSMFLLPECSWVSFS